MASLLEAASLQPAIVLVPGHAFVAWETWEGTDEWDYLETTMIASHDFEAARQRARSLFERFSDEDLPTDDGPLLRVLKLNDLRAAGHLAHGMSCRGDILLCVDKQDLTRTRNARMSRRIPAMVGLALWMSLIPELRASQDGKFSRLARALDQSTFVAFSEQDAAASKAALLLGALEYPRWCCPSRLGVLEGQRCFSIDRGEFQRCERAPR